MIDVSVENYKITGIIGRGGMGAIYYGRDITLKRPVAIKMIRPELVSEKQVVERFRSEAITTAKLNHPNIATVYELVQLNNAMFLVMEFVQGWTLSQVLRVCESLTPQQSIAVVKAALTAIGYAHKQGVIHRDLKPTNLMLNENSIVKVMDFGIARVLSGPKYTRTGQLVGTPKYMPPEQIRGDDLDARTDIYALGIVIYKLLTNRVPFSSDSDYQLMKAQVEQPPPPPKKFASQISDPLQAAILKALQKAAKDRFSSAKEFISALENCPENQNAGQDCLEALVNHMQKKHPIPIVPLNKEAVEAIKSHIRPVAAPRKRPGERPSMIKNIGQNMSRIARLNHLPPQNHLRVWIPFGLAVLVIGVLAFIFFGSEPSDVSNQRAITIDQPADQQNNGQDVMDNGVDQNPETDSAGNKISEKEMQWGVER